MTENELNLLQKLSFQGVDFTIKIPNNTGLEIHEATPADLALFFENPKALYAQHFGLTLNEYNQCVADDYNVYCSALTKRGYHCRGSVRGGRCTSPDNWKRLTGQYCPIHEGNHL
ncbi:hypothetical protein AAEH72_16000 [Shewanella xiamenensis]|jgi:hypothetical protein|uniref:hypothetical protein n=1 Tax=Shewanella TaxID=22 RepID=UPI000849861A|nr:hypothetical protein [Shewanella xiamenensis]MCT8869314.1 hypothetical protein [Shewanella xiamenensis]MCT8873843.1 hypothetical protein [Shewanella xiamenensis]MCT8877502.1 hypothetical protein [Shewanella xiamenensis]ODR83772.1 hypothetical protein ABT47_23735 [Shewanella xiamenensis]UWH39945.1 hypothetical protein KXJ80_00130 [Shewanella xiamenensis]